MRRPCPGHRDALRLLLHDARPFPRPCHPGHNLFECVVCDDSGFDSVEGGFVATEEDSFDDVPTEKVAQGHEEEADRF